MPDIPTVTEVAGVYRRGRCGHQITVELVGKDALEPPSHITHPCLDCTMGGDETVFEERFHLMDVYRSPQTLH